MAIILDVQCADGTIRSYHTIESAYVHRRARKVSCDIASYVSKDAMQTDMRWSCFTPPIVVTGDELGIEGVLSDVTMAQLYTALMARPEFEGASADV